MKRWLTIVLLMTGTGLAQTSWSVDQESGYTSNAFSNYTQTGDYLAALGLQVNQDWLHEQSGLRLYYRGELDAFGRYRDRTYHSQGLGLAFYSNLDESGSRLQTTVDFRKRFHTDAWQWYEQQQVTAQADLRWVALASFYVYTGLNWQYTDYTLLPLFSCQQPSLYVRTGWFLPTGTTILTEAGLLSKIYSRELNSFESSAGGSSLQSIFSLRLAQALNLSTGVHLDLLYRHNWASASRYLSYDDGSWFSDEELIDDSFGYHGPTVSASVKKRLSQTWTAQVSAMVQWKQYDLWQAAELNGELYKDGRLRKDRRSLLRVALEKKIALTAAWAPLTLSVEFSKLTNSSNDLYYHYNAEFLSLSLSQNF